MSLSTTCVSSQLRTIPRSLRESFQRLSNGVGPYFTKPEDAFDPEFQKLMSLSTELSNIILMPNAERLPGNGADMRAVAQRIRESVANLAEVPPPLWSAEEGQHDRRVLDEEEKKLVEQGRRLRRIAAKYNSPEFTWVSDFDNCVKAQSNQTVCVLALFICMARRILPSVQ